jgi:hypothetical protein
MCLRNSCLVVSQLLEWQAGSYKLPGVRRVNPLYNLKKPAYRKLQQHDKVEKIGVIVGIPTILNIRLFLLAPVIYLFALRLGIAGQTFKIESDTFLSSDYLLQGTGGAKIARTLIRFEPSIVVMLKLTSS